MPTRTPAPPWRIVETIFLPSRPQHAPHAAEFHLFFIKMFFSHRRLEKNPLNIAA
jgi:hypothetical protein